MTMVERLLRAKLADCGQESAEFLTCPMCGKCLKTELELLESAHDDDHTERIQQIRVHPKALAAFLAEKCR